jgi:hypothetical protein
MSEQSTIVDFIVSVHALERMHERFPEDVAGMEDEEIGRVIHAEVTDALEHGRESNVAPRELSTYRPTGWVPAGKDCSFAWNADKTRGYVLRDAEEGMLVITVLTSRERVPSRE